MDVQILNFVFVNKVFFFGGGALSFSPFRKLVCFFSGTFF